MEMAPKYTAVLFLAASFVYIKENDVCFSRTAFEHHLMNNKEFQFRVLADKSNNVFGIHLGTSSLTA